MRHLIIEGCDGTGKDTLIAQLLEVFPHFALHARASTSLEGPVPDLARWVSDDLEHIQRVDNDKLPIRWIFNRHPLISEPIYGRFRVNKPTVPLFLDQNWLNRQKYMLARYAVLVIVHPPWGVVNDILIGQGPHQHMPGVYENRNHIYDAYGQVTWPGVMMRFSRTSQNREVFINRLRMFMEMSND